MKLEQIKRFLPIASFAILALAVAVLLSEFAGIPAQEVFIFFRAMSTQQMLAAAGLTAASYLLLTGYDFLALRYVRRKLRFRDVLFASFTAFAVSNNVGFQILSGGSMRYRIYSSFGLKAEEIGKVVGFCTLTYALGAFTVGGLLALLDSADIASLVPLPQPLVLLVGAILLSLSAAYLIVAALGLTPVTIGRLQLHTPSFALAAAQVVIASIDAVLAASVMFILLPSSFGLPYMSYLSIYMIATTVSVLSLVPGGLGVYEVAVTFLMAPLSKAAVLSVFVAYRLIYFVIPLAIAAACLAGYEIRRMSGLSPARLCSKRR
ncbi:MAG: lysylphosphatidylglycerol synthase domain-containing protein [Pseudolabrys sp.]